MLHRLLVTCAVLAEDRLADDDLVPPRSVSLSYSSVSILTIPKTLGPYPTGLFSPVQKVVWPGKVEEATVLSELKSKCGLDVRPRLSSFQYWALEYRYKPSLLHNISIFIGLQLPPISRLFHH